MSRPRRAASVSINTWSAATLYISNGGVVYLSPNQTRELYATLDKLFGSENSFEALGVTGLPLKSKK